MDCSPERCGSPRRSVGPRVRSYAVKEHADKWLEFVVLHPRCFDHWIEDRFRPDANVLSDEALSKGELPCVLQIDRERGVLYVHSMINGITVLRICGLAKPVPDGPIDITIDSSGTYSSKTITYGTEVK
jgi:hypothetical protein